MNELVLVVDDEPELRDLLCDELAMAGYKTLSAENGRVAFEIVRTNPVAAIISDIRMPGGDGIELVKNMHAQLNKVPPVILISAYSESDSTIAKGLNTFAILPKPFTLEKLLELVNGALKSSL